MIYQKTVKEAFPFAIALAFKSCFGAFKVRSSLSEHTVIEVSRDCGGRTEKRKLDLMSKVL